ncbi:MAG TPA: PAS domain S-box protein [Acidimicrobiales bacterium]|nr:PAS domain S-box protein [Acidimicrobiales bacterium]
MAQDGGSAAHEAPEVSGAGLTDEDLSVFFELSTELFGVFEPRGGLVWCNASVESILGYEPDELRQVDLADLVHPDDLGAPTVDLEDFPRDGSARMVEVRCRAKDGGWRWLEWLGFWDAESELLYGAARDVTDRRERRVALVENERLLQAILDHSDSVIYVRDLQGRYLLVNEAFLRTVGRTRSEVVGRRDEELWSDRSLFGAKDDATVVAECKALTTDVTIEVDGSPRTFLTTRFPVLDPEGAVIGMAAIATNVTERTEVERRLSKRQRLLETIVTACPDIVTVLDRAAKVEEVSSSSSRILGLDLQGAPHEQLEALVHPDDMPAIYGAFGDLLARRLPQLDMRYRVRHADGHWVTLDVRGQAIVSDGGEVEGAVVVSRDITADLVFEEELQQAVADAERASRAKSEFLSRMSHQLRTPLNSVLGFAQLLSMDDLAEQQQEAVAHILRAGQHLLNLIDEVLDISSIESGRLDLSLEPVAVGEVVRDAVDLTRPLAEARGVRIEFERRCPGDVFVLADRQRLLQVLLNLLSNGVKYNHPDGSVSVAADVDDSAGESVVRLTVADTGPGIAPEDADRVFRPFDRLGAERSGVQGTGVGLTLSKHLVEQMNGSIAVQSEVGAGATFTVSLSLAPALQAKAADDGPARRREMAGGGLRVLHIEDNLANLELVEQIMARAGSVELRAAMYGSLGLELAREHHPDLVLLDLHLPDMTGADVLERLRADADTADVPVVVVSADATPHHVRQLQDGGVLAYLTKPIDVRELLRVVELVSAGSTM